MRRLAGCLIVAAIAGVLSGSATGAGSATWALPAANLAGTRAATGSVLSAANVKSLRVSWRFPLTDPADGTACSPRHR